MNSRSRPWSRPLHGLLLGGAWLFIVASLLHLFWAVGAKIDSPGGVAKLYHTVIDGVSYDALGLTYSGPVGLAQALLQVALLVAATAFTLGAWRGRRAVRLRRLGHAYLLGWSLLWAGNLAWLASLDHQTGSVAQAAVLWVLFGCTGYRAMSGWSPPGRLHDESDADPPLRFAETPADERAFPVESPKTDVAPHEKLMLLARDIGSSPRLRELSRSGLRRTAARGRVTVGRLARQGRDALARLPRPHRAGVRRAVRATRREVATGLRCLARFTTRQADRLGGTSSSSPGGSSRPA